MVARHRAFLSDKDIRGRVYISGQGINTQAGGVKEEVTAYAEWVASQPEFQGLRYTLWTAPGRGAWEKGQLDKGPEVN
jgi:predicted sulfurtransferase